MKSLLFLFALSLCLYSQTVPPSGAVDPRGVSQFKPYDWTAPLNFPNDATLFLRGDRTWAVVGSGNATANSTVPSIPFLSSIGIYSDSPLFRADANTIEQRNGVTNQCQKIYSSYTDASNNAGISVCPSAVVTTIQLFKNGTGSIGALAINVPTGNTGTLQVAGTNIVRWASTGTDILTKISNVGPDGTSGQYGVGTIIGSFALDGHNDATRNDIVCPSLVAERQAIVIGTFTVNVIQAGATATTTLNWTDGGNSVAKSVTFPNLDISSLTNQVIIVQPIRYKGATTASFTTTTAAIGVGSYNARVACVATF